MATDPARPVRSLRLAAISLVAGYAALLTSFVIRHPFALTVLIPLGGFFVLVGIALWLRVVVAEARAKDMV